MSKAAELAALIGSGQAQGNKNIIINGAMNVAQRSTSVSSLSSTATYSTCDRWMVQYGTAGTFTESQSSTAPDGFANSLKLDCTTADASPGYLLIIQNVEGQNLQQIKKGTSNALRTVMSFHVRSNKTGTYQVNIFDKDNTRIVGASYTIDSANTWEKKSVTFPADTTGAFDDDNNNSLQIEWWLASGSTYNTGTLPTAWETRDNADRAAALNVAIGASTDDEFYITGVQFEIGDVATAFEHENIGTTLAKCQRYYFRWTADTAYDGVIAGFCLNSTQAFGTYNMPVTMRTPPTMSGGGNWNIFTVGEQAATGFSLNQATPHNVMTYATASSGMTAGSGCLMRTNNDDDAYFEFIAEL
jgi:hypothetical protein